MAAITLTPFRELAADRDHPLRAEATAQFTQPDGTTQQATISLFMLEDGRIGVGMYPSPDRGAVLRWDNGPDAEPCVIFWQAPHCHAGLCDSPCGHQVNH